MGADLIAALVCIGLIVAIVCVAKFSLSREAESRLRGALAWIALLGWVFMQVWYLLPAHRDWSVSLPLHICDIAALLMPFVLWGGSRWMRSLLYFWGFAFTTHGFITPVLDVGPDHVKFWLFWFNHSVVFGGAVYDVVVLGYRPTARDLLTAIAITVCYVAVVLPINLIAGWNYGFVGNTAPAVPTLIDALGLWPLRLVWIALLGIVVFVLLWLPWKIKFNKEGSNVGSENIQENDTFLP